MNYNVITLDGSRCICNLTTDIRIGYLCLYDWSIGDK